MITIIITITRVVALRGKIPTHCVPSNSVRQSTAVSICPLCCTWFGYKYRIVNMDTFFGCQEISGTEDIIYIKIQ